MHIVATRLVQKRAVTAGKTITPTESKVPSA